MSRRSGPSTAAAALAGPLTAVGFAVFTSSCSSHRDLPPLVLQLQDALEVPAHVVVQGIVRGAHGAIGVFESGSPRLHIYRHDADPRTLVVASGGIVGAAFAGADSIVEIATKEPFAIRRLTMAGKLLESREFDVPGQAQEAHRDGGAWFISTLDRSGLYRIYILPRGSREAPVYSLEGAAAANTPAALWIRFTVSQMELLITRRVWPFAVDRVRVSHADGDVWHGIAMGTTRPPDDGLTADTRRSWISLPAVSLGSRYLQTLSNLQSDERRLVVVDVPRGSVQVRHISAPLGLVGSVPSDSIVFGMRRLDTQEVVTYRWK